MARGNDRSGNRLKKRVSLSEIDDFLDAYLAEPEVSPQADIDDFIEQAEAGDVVLPYPFDLALDLFLAYKDHGVMESAGGYLDQSRAWRGTIRFFQWRLNKARDRMGQAKRDRELFGDGEGG